MPRTFTPITETTGPAAVHWPEPSPLDDWWTEIMDGVTPHRKRDTTTPPSRRSRT